MDPFQGRLGLADPLLREVDGLAVGYGQQLVAYGQGVVPLGHEAAQRVEVALGLGHLFPAHVQVLAVQPVLHERLARGPLALGDLVLVVGEDQVSPAAVEVEAVAQVLHAHGGALEVPARPPRPEGGVPVRFPFPPALPEDEVAGAVALVLVRVDARPVPHAGEVLLGQLAVLGETTDPEIDGAFALVGPALVEQRLDQGDHLGDVGRRRAEDVGPADAQGVQVLQESGRVLLRVVLQRHAGLERVADGLVVDVGHVHDVGHFVPFPPQVAVEDVLEHERPEIADVGKIVHRRAAAVQSDLRRLQGLEWFADPAQRVLKSKHVNLQYRYETFLTSPAVTENSGMIWNASESFAPILDSMSRREKIVFWSARSGQIGYPGL